MHPLPSEATTESCPGHPSRRPRFARAPQDDVRVLLMVSRSHDVAPGQVLAAERRRADALAGRVVDRIGDGRWRRRAGRLAEAAPLFTAGRCEDRLALRNLIDAEQVVG